MANYTVVFGLLLISLLMHIGEANEMVDDTRIRRSLLQTIDCGGLCQYRCSLSSRPNLCHRACGTCCSRCNCVPPGTSGNEDVCPCYANMTTHDGRKKCP